MGEPEAEDYSQPLLPGTAGSDYERYLNTEELLALQKGPGEWVHRDELLFQTVHQSSELWLKLAWNEVETAAELVESGDLAGALRRTVRGDGPPRRHHRVDRPLAPRTVRDDQGGRLWLGRRPG